MTHATKARTGTLDDIATDSHVFSIIAMDQRNTLRRMFAGGVTDGAPLLEDLAPAWIPERLQRSLLVSSHER